MAIEAAFPRIAAGALLMALLCTAVRAGEAQPAPASSNPPSSAKPPAGSTVRPAPLPADARLRVLRQMFPGDGFAYFSGHEGSSHNLPAMYAFRDGSGEKLAVIGRGTRQEFPVARTAEAFQAYRALLARNGYHL
jgi:hypothetical protein